MGVQGGCRKGKIQFLRFLMYSAQFLDIVFFLTHKYSPFDDESSDVLFIRVVSCM